MGMLRALWQAAALTCVVFAFSACSWQTPKPYTKQLKMGGVEAVSLDIKQRMVFERDIPGGPGQPTHVVVCPEPSPDALSATAASLNLTASGAEKVIQQIAAGGTTKETAAMVGLRTQSIQLLRDQLTHLCLGYMNNALNSGAYALLLRREQRLTLGLLAVEQLTGAAVAQTSIVNAPDVSKSDTVKSSDKSGKSPSPKGSATQDSDTNKSSTAPGNDQPGDGADSQATPSATGATRYFGTASADSLLKVVDTKPPVSPGKDSQKKKPDAATKSPVNNAESGSSVTKDDATPQLSGKSAAKDISALAPAVQTIVHDVLTTGFEEEECLAVMALAGTLGADGKPVAVGEVVKTYCDNILQIGLQKTDDQLKVSQEKAALGGPISAVSAHSSNADNSLFGYTMSPDDRGPAYEPTGRKLGVANERLGFRALQSFKYADAAKYFKDADAAYPSLGNASELAVLLGRLPAQPSSEDECSTIKTISDLYSWRLPGMTKLALHGKYDALNCPPSHGEIKF